jgi:hypothetical protein
MGAQRQIRGERLSWLSRTNIDRHQRRGMSRRARIFGGTALAITVLSLVPTSLARERSGKFNASAVTRISPTSAHKAARVASRQSGHTVPEAAKSTLPLATIGLLIVGVLGLLSAWLTFEVAHTNRTTAEINERTASINANTQRAQLDAAQANLEAARIGERTARIEFEAAPTASRIAVPAADASVLPSNDGDGRPSSAVDQTNQLHRATSAKKRAKPLARPPD